MHEAVPPPRFGRKTLSSQAIKYCNGADLRSIIVASRAARAASTITYRIYFVLRIIPVLSCRSNTFSCEVLCTSILFVRCAYPLDNPV